MLIRKAFNEPLASAFLRVLCGEGLVASPAMFLCWLFVSPTQFYSAMPSPQSPDPPSIESLIDANQLATARQRLDELVASQGESAHNLLLEAMLLHKERKFVESLKKLQRSLQLDPGSANAHKLAGLNLVSLNKEDLAPAYFQRALELSPRDYMARYYLGLYYLTKKKGVIAEQHFKQVVTLNPSYVEGHCLLGLAREAQGQHEDAIETYRRAAALAEQEGAKDETPYLYLGRLLILLDRYEQSVPVLQRAIDLNPSSKEALNSLGQSLAKTGRDEKALEVLQRAAKLDPNDKSPHYQMMHIYRRHNRLEDARREMQIFRELEEAESKNPSRQP